MNVLTFRCASLCFVRVEGDGEQLVGGEEEFRLSDS